MKQLLILLSLAILIGCKQEAQTITQISSENDSLKVAHSSLKFYNWYLDCLKADSTFNIVQPIYHWEDTIPVLDISEYLDRLPMLGVLSENFIRNETQRFKICQDSLNTIDHKEVDSCGCSVGLFYMVCDFIEYFYWINTQEKYDGCEIKEIKINNREATCQLIFFYDLENSKEKNIDKNFICILHLNKVNDKWLIDSINKYTK